jgi:glycosyltransferase involved in cell wall biosynthesis
LAELSYVLRGASRRFEQAFAERRFDLVHAHFGPAGAYARQHAARHRLPLLVTFHGYDVPLLLSRRRFLPLHLPYAVGSAALLRELTLGLCASSELKQLLIQAGVDERRLRVHRLGVDLERFRYTEGPREPLVLMVGRLVEKKGFDDGLRAFARARSLGVVARLAIVGEGERRASLQRLSRQLGIAAEVSFLGSKSNPEVAELLARSSVLLAPSVVARDGNRESGLIVVKEASAAGVVPIGTLHGGIPDSIDHGRTGYLVAERDPTAMGDQLAQLLREPELRTALARAGRAKMEREFDNRRLVAELEDIYEEVCERWAGRAGAAPAVE